MSAVDRLRPCRADRRWASRWLGLFCVLAGVLAGCATLNETTRLESSAGPRPGHAYLYGRFRLDHESLTQPRLLLQLFDLGRTTPLTIPLRQTTQELDVIELAPGRYQFTQLVFVPLGAGDSDVRRDNLRLVPPVDFMGQAFDVEAGKAYYVGEWEGQMRRKIDFYFVFSNITLRWGIHRLAFDYERTTADLKRLYPALVPIETQPAWSR